MVKISRKRSSPVAERITAALRKDLENLDVDAQIPSERELSVAFKASRVTIRRVLQGLKREGLLYAQAGKGFFRSNPQHNRTMALEGASIGLSLTNIDVYNVDVMRAILDEAAKHKMHVLPHNNENDVEQQISYLKSLRNNSSMRGLLLNPPLHKDDIQKIIPVCQELSAGGMSVIFLNTPGFEFPFDHVGFDDHAGIGMIVRMLYDQGHRRIAYITERDWNVRQEIRYSGFTYAVESLGIAEGSRIVYYSAENTHLPFKNWQVKLEGDPATLVFEKGITAFITHSDKCSAILYHLLHENDIAVPEDVSITGYDHLGHIVYPVPLTMTTTVRDRSLFGQTAFNMLISKLLSAGEGRGRPQNTLLPVQLLAGETCGRARAECAAEVK